MIPTAHPAIFGPTDCPSQSLRPRGRTGPNLPPLVRANKQIRVIYECERCGRLTYQPLKHSECGAYQSMGPDISVDEIKRMKAQIKAENMERLRRGESEGNDE